MRLRRLCLLLVSSALTLLTVFSSVSINAYALSGGTYLPVQAALSYFGDEIPVTYHTANGDVDTVFRYYGTDSFSSIPGYPEYIDGQLNPEYNADYVTYCTNASFLVYSADLTGIVNDPTQIVIDVSPQYSIFDTQQIVCAIGVSGTNYSTSAYTSASWDWYFNGQNVHTESPLNEYGFGLRAQSHTAQTWYNLVPVSLQSQSTTSGYSVRSVFPVGDSTCYLCIGCPYVSLGSSGESGIAGIQTGTTSSSSSAGGGSVDLDETNGLLGGIIDLLDGLVDGIASLFIPEQNTIEAFENSLADLLLDTYGGIDSDMLDNTIQDLLTHGATESVTFPAYSVPGTNFSMPAYNVPLKPHSVQGRALYEGLALAIDLVCTAAVINLVLHNIKVFLVGEKVVEVEDAD